MEWHWRGRRGRRRDEGLVSFGASERANAVLPSDVIDHERAIQRQRPPVEAIQTFQYILSDTPRPSR